MNINIRFRETPCIIRRKKRRSVLFQERAGATVKDRKLTHFSIRTSSRYILSFPFDEITSSRSWIQGWNSSETPWHLHRVQRGIRLFGNAGTSPIFCTYDSRRNESIIARETCGQRGLCQLCKVSRHRRYTDLWTHVSRQVENIGVEEERGETRSEPIACTLRAIMPIRAGDARGSEMFFADCSG